MEKKFVDMLSTKLVNKANENIKNDLYDSWCENNLNLLDFDSDREWAEASGIDEIKQAFNKFYNLTEADTFKFLD